MATVVGNDICGNRFIFWSDVVIDFWFSSSLEIIDGRSKKFKGIHVEDFHSFDFVEVIEIHLGGPETQNLPCSCVSRQAGAQSSSLGHYEVIDTDQDRSSVRDAWIDSEYV